MREYVRILVSEKPYSHTFYAVGIEKNSSMKWATSSLCCRSQQLHMVKSGSMKIFNNSNFRASFALNLYKH